jgi:hypothetical protein
VSWQASALVNKFPPLRLTAHTSPISLPLLFFMNGSRLSATLALLNLYCDYLNHSCQGTKNIVQQLKLLEKAKENKKISIINY